MKETCNFVPASLVAGVAADRLRGRASGGAAWRPEAGRLAEQPAGRRGGRLSSLEAGGAAGGVVRRPLWRLARLRAGRLVGLVGLQTLSLAWRYALFLDVLGDSTLEGGYDTTRRKATS